MSYVSSLAHQEDATSSDDTAAPITPLAQPKQQGLRMLLVEDQLSDVFLAEALMENSMPDYNWQIIDKPSMSKAITLLQQIHFDVALVDLTLQDMDGAETVATLHAAAPTMPIIVYSGSGNPDLLREAVRNGAQFYIEKGKTETRLVRAIIQSALEPEL